jgi:hypothetical protein
MGVSATEQKKLDEQAEIKKKKEEMKKKRQEAEQAAKRKHRNKNGPGSRTVNGEVVAEDGGAQAEKEAAKKARIEAKRTQREKDGEGEYVGPNRSEKEAKGEGW